MSQATITAIASGSRAAGTYTFAATPVPVGVFAVRIDIVRPTFASDNSFLSTWSIDLSQDGGATWLSWGSATIDNRIANSNDAVSTSSGFQVALPNPGNPNRMVRGSITINKTVTTSVVLTIFS